MTKKVRSICVVGVDLVDERNLVQIQKNISILVADVVVELSSLSRWVSLGLEEDGIVIVFGGRIRYSG